MNILSLTLKREYFNQILSGEKTEEYRELSEYWFKRLDDQIDCKTYTHVSFRNGYNPTSPFMIVELKKVSCEEIEWLEDDSDKVIDSAEMYVLELGRIVEVRNLTSEMKSLMAKNKKRLNPAARSTKRKI